MPPPNPTPPAKQAPAPRPKPEKKVFPPVDLELYVEVGETVEYYPSADPTAKPQPAICSALGFGAIDCNVVHPSLHGIVPQTGVMHISDPRARTDAGMEGGGWRHRPITVATRRLLLAAGMLAWDGESKYVVLSNATADHLAPKPATPQGPPTT